MHLRTLIEFFYFKPKESYVRASDFFAAAGEWDPKMPPALKMVIERASEEATHLTWGRKSGTPAEKEWDVAGLRSDIEAVAKDFAARALASRLHFEVRKFLGLPSGEKLAWLVDNVAYSNVASQTLVYSPSASTATMLKVPFPRFGIDVDLRK